MIFALSGARLLLDGQLQAGKALLIDGGRIAGIVEEAELDGDLPIRHLAGGILAPGFVDVQVNGGGGVLFNDEPTVDAIRRIGAAHRAFGTTGFLPTLISDDLAVIAQAVRAVETAIEEGVPGVLGIHLEGPMLSPDKKGIHDASKFQGPDPDLLAAVGALRNGVRLVTLAPECVGPEAIAALAKANVIVAIGHTNATYEQTREALAKGARGFTHLFNAMSPMTSRAPGVVGAALDDQDSWCGIIADGMHVDPAVLRIAMRSRPVDRFMLVTDAMSPVGTDASSFELQGQTIFVKNGKYVDEFGTLAGSSLDMATAVRNSVRDIGLDFAIALQAAATFPAEFLGLSASRGAIAPGLAADLVWLDDDVRVRDTWIEGASASGHECGARAD